MSSETNDDGPDYNSSLMSGDEAVPRRIRGALRIVQDLGDGLRWSSAKDRQDEQRRRDCDTERRDDFPDRRWQTECRANAHGENDSHDPTADGNEMVTSEQQGGTSRQRDAPPRVVERKPRQRWAGRRAPFGARLGRWRAQI